MFNVLYYSLGYECLTNQDAADSLIHIFIFLPSTLRWDEDLYKINTLDGWQVGVSNPDFGSVSIRFIRISSYSVKKK